MRTVRLDGIDQDTVSPFTQHFGRQHGGMSLAFSRSVGRVISVDLLLSTWVIGRMTLPPIDTVLSMDTEHNFGLCLNQYCILPLSPHEIHSIIQRA